MRPRMKTFSRSTIRSSRPRTSAKPSSGPILYLAFVSGNVASSSLTGASTHSRTNRPRSLRRKASANSSTLTISRRSPPSSDSFPLRKRPLLLLFLRKRSWPPGVVTSCRKSAVSFIGGLTKSSVAKWSSTAPGGPW